MTFKVIRGQGQSEEMTSVHYRDNFLPLSTVDDRAVSEWLGCLM